MKIIPTNDEFEATLNTPPNKVQELMPFHQIFLMETLKYNTSGNCSYFLPLFSAECGIGDGGGTDTGGGTVEFPTDWEGESYSVHTNKDTVYFEGTVSDPNVNVTLFIANEPFRKAMPNLPKVPSGEYTPTYRSYPAVNNGDGTWSCTISEIIDIGENPHAQFSMYIELECQGVIRMGRNAGGFNYYDEPAGSWLYVYSQVSMLSFGTSGSPHYCHTYWLVDLGTGEIRADKGSFYDLAVVLADVPRVGLNGAVGWTYSLNDIAIRYHNTTPYPVTYNLYQVRMDETGGIRDPNGNISACSGVFENRTDFGYVDAYLPSMPAETFIGSNQFTEVKVTRKRNGTVTHATITIDPLIDLN